MTRVGLLVWLATLTALAANPPEARSCSCLPNPGIEHVFANAENVVLVNVRKEVRRMRRIPGVPTRDGTHRVYRAKIRRSYKGCIRRGRILKLYAAKESSLCGVELDSRRDYVLALGESTGKGKTFEINSCGFIRPRDSLTAAEVEFLNTRDSCCRGRCRCVDSERVSCLVDPCLFASCSEGTCVSNLCGNCSAEFYDDEGQPVCTTCTNDFDCPQGQECAAGQCKTTASCESDDQCQSDFWCRPTEEIGTSACTPLAGEGETCGGYTPPWHAEICAPGLRCVRPPPEPGTPELPDAPGVCTPAP